MAYNDSGELSPSQSYQLGGYTFELRSNYDGDEEVTGIVARMTYNGETKVKGIDIDGQATVESWSVEANETEASVYVTIKGFGIHYITETATGELIPERFYQGQPIGVRGYRCLNIATLVLNPFGSTIKLTQWNGYVYASGYSGTYGITVEPSGQSSAGVWSSGNWGDTFSIMDAVENFRYGVIPESTGNPEGKKPGTQVQDGTYLVARFAIDIREAGGGPDGDWDEPGDTGDPSYTLNVSITGASSGTHNASSIPLEAGLQNVYGSGGIGGNGGGGGAGASTVIIYEFATDKAGSVNQTATARGPGSGGPGGSGGRGADGCIIIFY